MNAGSAATPTTAPGGACARQRRPVDGREGEIEEWGLHLLALGPQALPSLHALLTKHQRARALSWVPPEASLRRILTASLCEGNEGQAWGRGLLLTSFVISSSAPASNKRDMTALRPLYAAIMSGVSPF